MKPELIESESQHQAAVAGHANVAMDFFSTECPPCEKLAPIFERAANRFPHIHFAKIHRQAHRPLASSIGVNGSPTLVFYKDGRLLEERLAGEIDEKDLNQTLETLFPSNEHPICAKDESEITERHDLLIIGSGPAGLTAAVYAARYGIDQVVVGELDGGLMTSSHKICNYPSENEISGMALTQKMVDHVTQLQVPRKLDSVVSVCRSEGVFEAKLSGGETILAKTVLLATGTKHRHLGLPMEKELTGRGISYCATCDAMFYKGKTVAVVGGGDSANTAALYLAEVAEKVYQLYRGPALKGETAWIDQIKKNPKITTLFNTNATQLVGSNRLEGVELDKSFDGNTTLKIDGLFVEIGSDPDRTLIDPLGVATDKNGYIVTQPDQRTSLEGVWAAGDITTNSDGFRQIITAASEGAVAAQSIFRHLQKKQNRV